MDSSSSSSKSCHGQTVDSITNGTMAGTFTSNQAFLLHGITFPEFSSSLAYEEISAHRFHSLCHYNIIFGQDVCHLPGIHLNFEDDLMEFKDQTLLMKEYPSDANLSTSKLSQELLLDWLDDDILDNTTASVITISNDNVCMSDTNDNAGPHPDTIDQSDDNIAMGSRYHSKTIKESSYNSQSIEDAVSSCTHLNMSHQQDLLQILCKYKTLFNGTLGKYPHEQVHLELLPGATPHRSRPYQIPKAHMKVFKAELDCLVHISVLEPTCQSEWMFRTFIIPKKDTSV